MKYLKKFNESSYYKRITLSEYRDDPVSYEAFTEKEYWAIDNLMKSKDKDLVIELDPKEHEITIHFPYISSAICTIYKFADEWFYVRISGFNIKVGGQYGGFFKCDQFDGLISLLRLIRPSKPQTKIKESNDYYKEISTNDYDSRDGDRLKFNSDEISIIEGILKRKNKNVILKILYDSTLLIFRINDRFFCSISKYDDEWYFVHKDQKSFKCDQFDGLVKFLKNIKFASFLKRYIE